MSTEEKIVSYPNSIETRVALLEMSINTINQTLIRLETKIDDGFRETKEEFKEIRQDLSGFRRENREDFQSIHKLIWSNFKWTTAGFAALLGVMAHGFHWF